MRRRRASPPSIAREGRSRRASLYIIVPSALCSQRALINSYIEGYDAEASSKLLDELWAYATQPKFCYEHHWRIGDLLLWDNRSTMHRRDPFDNGQRRMMHRTQIKGKSAPIAAMSAAA